MIILAILLTAFVYLFFPIVYVMKNGKVSPKKGKKLALLNVIVCALLFFIATLIYVSASKDNSKAEIGGYSLAPAFFYYFIAKWILIKSTSHTNEEDDISEEENYEEDENGYSSEEDFDEDSPSEEYIDDKESPKDE